jgi:uncharacterized protein YuzE
MARYEIERAKRRAQEVLSDFDSEWCAETGEDANVEPYFLAQVERLAAAGLLAAPTPPPAINVTVDREANAAYVRVAEGVVFRTAEINGSVHADYGQDFQLLGVEILDLPLAPAAQQTHLQAADELGGEAAQLASTANVDRHETEYAHGYRIAHERIVAWLREEFEPAAAPADDEATTIMRTLHVTATRNIPDGHTDQRVRYEYEGESWEGWLISVGPGDFGEEAYVMRDNGERWVVKPDNITPIDNAGALAALRGEQP